MSRFIFYSPTSFEPWGPDALERGIGGSETSHIELSWRLAKRGHEVISYSPGGPDLEWRGVQWRPLEKCDFRDVGTWLIYRSPMGVNSVPAAIHNSTWLICQDMNYAIRQFFPSGNVKICWEVYANAFDRVVALCPTHQAYIQGQCPDAKVCLSSNGIATEGEWPALPRDPKRLIYSSSPDRGLKNLLQIFRKAREWDPDLSLHIFYGFDNILKIMDKTPFAAQAKAEIEKLLKQPNVFWHGRIGQRQLREEFLKSGIWCHPSNFEETGAITSMEAMAGGAIPITRPIWAIGDQVEFGIFERGSADDPLVQARYAADVVKLANAPALQESIRADMMPWARARFDWERVVDQMEGWANGEA